LLFGRKTMAGLLPGAAIVAVALLAILFGYTHSQSKNLDWQGTILPLAELYADVVGSSSSSSSLKAEPLAGKVVIVTGCTSGLGLSLSRAVSQLGATVVGIGRSEERLARWKTELSKDRSSNSGQQLVTVMADFSDLAAVARAANAIIENWDRIDMLINNAGMHDSFDNLKGDAVSKQGYDRVFAVNYLSHFLLTEKLAATLHKADKPTVLQISSSFHWAVDGSDLMVQQTDNLPIAARPGGSHGFVFFRSLRSYANSKLAQLYHNRALKQNHPLLSSPKVRLVSACPGWVATNIGGRPGSFFHTWMQAGFPAQGWGIASALMALLDYDTWAQASLPLADYYINSSVFRFANVLLGRQAPHWLYSTGLRDIMVFTMAVGTIWLQNMGAHAAPAKSSPESYNRTIAYSLYDWSYQTIEEYLE
jgi:NAD(P)-dependent dehydrogenase (short-subunit alcohol dehydrogenase family)